MGEITAWILGAIVVFLGGAWAVEKGKRSRAEDQRDEAERQAVEAETEADVEKIEREHDDARRLSGSDYFRAWYRERERRKRNGR